MILIFVTIMVHLQKTKPKKRNRISNGSNLMYTNEYIEIWKLKNLRSFNLTMKTVFLSSSDVDFRILSTSLEYDLHFCCSNVNCFDFFSKSNLNSLLASFDFFNSPVLSHIIIKECFIIVKFIVKTWRKKCKTIYICDKKKLTEKNKIKSYNFSNVFSDIDYS